MRCRVTESYSIELPFGVKKEIELEDSLTNYWFEGEDFFLQLSSYKHTSAQVVQASHRLRNYLADEGKEELTPITLAVNAPDSAAVTYADENQQRWLISFLVWPDLTIFATILSRDEHRPVLDSWASRAIESIERTMDD